MMNHLAIALLAATSTAVKIMDDFNPDTFVDEYADTGMDQWNCGVMVTNLDGYEEPIEYYNVEFDSVMKEFVEIEGNSSDDESDYDGPYFLYSDDSEYDPEVEKVWNSDGEAVEYHSEDWESSDDDSDDYDGPYFVYSDDSEYDPEVEKVWNSDGYAVEYHSEDWESSDNDSDFEGPNFLGSSESEYDPTMEKVWNSDGEAVEYFGSD